MTRLGILVALGLAVPGWAQAGSFEVNPVGLTLSGTDSTGVVTVTNASDSLTVVQLQVVAWSQENGEDVYTPTRNVLATPPIFTVPVGGQQTVRLGLMTKPDAKLETAYRLFLRAAACCPKNQGFRDCRCCCASASRVFAEPAVATAPELHWSARRLSATEISVEAANDGSAHVQIEKLKLSINAQVKPLAERLGGYVLPGTHSSWILKLPAPLAAGQSLLLTALILTEVLSSMRSGARKVNEAFLRTGSRPSGSLLTRADRDGSASGLFGLIRERRLPEPGTPAKRRAEHPFTWRGSLAAVEIVLLLLSACHSRRPVLPDRGTPMPPMVVLEVSPAATAATPVLHTPIPACGCSSESETQPSSVSIATTAKIVTSTLPPATGAQSAHTQTTVQAATAVALIELLLEVGINAATQA